MFRSNPALWPKPPAIWGYGIAVVSVGAVLTLSQLPAVHLQDAPVSLFLCAVILTAWFGGIGPGLLATALSVLAYGGACTLGELASAEQVTAATMSRVFAGLESLGLAERRRSSDDARATVVNATRKGKALLERARAARLRRVRELLDKASSREVSALGDALDAVFPH